MSKQSNNKLAICSWQFTIFTNCLLLTAFVTLSVVEGFSQGTWTQKADFGGGERIGAVGFSIGTKGYIGTGHDGTIYHNDFWEYDPTTNSWTQKANFGGSIRAGATGFSIGSKGYIGLGSDTSGHTKDFWEYDPNLVLINEIPNNASVSVFPNPFSTSATFTISLSTPLGMTLPGMTKQNLQFVLYDCYGRAVKNFIISSSEFKLDRGDLQSGVYFYKVTGDASAPLSTSHVQWACGKIIIE